MTRSADPLPTLERLENMTEQELERALRSARAELARQEAWVHLLVAAIELHRL